MDNARIGFLLVFIKDELNTFHKVKIIEENIIDKIRISTINKYEMRSINELDLLSKKDIQELIFYGYKQQSDNTMIVFIDKLKTLFGGNLTEEDEINNLRYFINNHYKFKEITKRLDTIRSTKDFFSTIEDKQNIPQKIQEAKELRNALVNNGEIIIGERKKAIEPKIDEDIRENQMKETTLPPISDTIKAICKKVIGQDEAVRKSVQAIYDNLNLITKNKSLSEIVTLKNNILMSGKSGCGKTEIARQIEAVFNIPVCIEDITKYTGAGWQGKEIIEILKKLYLISGEKIEIAQRGVIVLDEIDKIAIDKSNDRKSHNTLEVQQGLLKIIEGGNIDLEIGRFGPGIPFDTRFLTVIGTGAFNEYNRLNNLSLENKYFLKQDYINYGLMPEFVRRFKTFITLRELTFEDKKRILLESDLSVLNLKISDLKSRGIKVNIECSLDKLCEEIIKKSEKLSNGECGVSDLNEIAFNMFNEIYYRLYDGEKLSEIIINEKTIEDPTQVSFVKK